MPCAASQLTVTTPLAGWGNVNEYGPAPEPETPVEADPLMRMSPAFTPVTLSENVIATLVSVVTPEPGVGVVVVTVGAAKSVNMPVHNKTSINGKEDFMGGEGWGRKSVGAVGNGMKVCQKSSFDARLKFLSQWDCQIRENSANPNPLERTSPVIRLERSPRITLLYETISSDLFCRRLFPGLAAD